MLELTEIAISAAIEGAREIMKVYAKEDFNVQLKSDQSPLTEADLKSNAVIEAALSKTHIPILSEEGAEILYEDRKNWKQLWIVDPLDGTKEFVKRNGEFTVNIALAENSYPVMGVIFAPYLNCLYWGDESGACKSQFTEDWMDITTDKVIAEMDIIRLPNPLPELKTLVASKSHFTPETGDYIELLKEKEGEIELVSKGSSLKMCLVAEGQAHLYPRLGPTMEWDTAAGQAIIEATGGQLFDWHTKERMCYNRPELRNGWFLCVASAINPQAYWLLNEYNQ
ncbi:MAG: 3'(2'),5'-bisphosphate nucleotidase CysQ [Marinilabiliaceae bacterium]|nr:3'(2'),5'-bisphosphate nucleotidase CysQ [Marinilabiliaceae bacterium]